MAKRPSRKQSEHDAKVKDIAQSLERQGYRVSADLPGHKKPPTIGGRVPDVVGTKGNKVRIREIETPDTLHTDAPQQRAIRSRAERMRKQGKDVEVRVISTQKRR